jgi:hypothetical protein
MAKFNRYALAAVCFAASVGCLALWWRSQLHYRTILGPTYLGEANFQLNACEGCVGFFLWSNNSKQQWTYESFPIKAESAARLKGPEGNRFGLRSIGSRTKSLFFPLWYPALVFALAGVAVLRFRRQFSIRSALITVGVVAALLGMVVAL